MAATLVILSLPTPAAAAPTPTVTVTNVTVTEGTGATVNANFTIKAAPAPRVCCPLQVAWTTAPGSASTADFTPASGTVTLAKGAASRVVSIAVTGDALDEPSETFVVNLTSLTGSPGRIGDAQGVATITDDDGPSISVDDAAVTEGDAGAATLTFTASIPMTSALPVTFDWVTAGGSATAGADFVAANGTGTIPAGSTSAPIDVAVSGDLLDEADETLTITLSNPGNATIGDGSGVGTIVDDDPLPVLGVADASVSEGNAGTATITFTVSLSSASGRSVSVDWATQDDEATAPSDYAAASGTVTFVPGDTTETIDVTVNGDALAELDEDLRVVLSSPSAATLGDAVGIGTIVDDELLPVIDIDEPSTTEGDSGTAPLTFTVTLSHPAAFPVTVDWATAAGTAAAGVDYVSGSGTVSFAAMDTSETVEITLNGDGTYEADETFAVDLSNSSGAPIGDPQGIGTILNDDAAPVFSVDDVSVGEGNTGTRTLTFVVSLAGPTDVDASVGFATANGTATAGSDYQAASGTLTIPAGAATGTVDVTVHGDGAHESNETLTFALSGPSDASIGDGVAQGTILNDDRAPTTITLRIVRRPRAVVAKGILEPTQLGHRVTASLFRKVNGRFVRVASRSVPVRYVRDRDGDGKKDGAYTASFVRPRAGGTYKVRVRFAGTATHRPSSRQRIFTLRAT